MIDAPALEQLPLTSAALDADPHGNWADLQARHAVAHAPALGLVVATRYEEVARICRDAEVFSAETPDGPLTRTLGTNFMHSDGDLHRSVRAALAPALRGAAVRNGHEGWLRQRTRDLLAESGERVEVVADLAFPLAAESVSRLSGVDASPADWASWFTALAAGVSNFEGDQRKTDAAAECSAAISAAVARAAGQERGLVGVLCAAGFPREVVESTVKLLVIGGVQEPRDLLGFAVWGLQESGQWAEAVADSSLLRGAVEEAARWGSPVGSVTRTTTCPVTLGGVDLPTGTPVAAILAAANRDPRRWTDPDRFDARRDEGGHLGYGAGAHLCIGAALSRVLVRVVLEELVELRPGARLDSQPRATGWEFCSPGAVVLEGC